MIIATSSFPFSCISKFLRFEARYGKLFFDWLTENQLYTSFSTKIDQKAVTGNIIATELYWNSQLALYKGLTKTVFWRLAKYCFRPVVVDDFN